MKKTKLILTLTLILLTSLTVAGCLQKQQQVPKYPEAQEIQIPNQVANKLRNEILPNSTLTAYATQDSPTEVRDWYNQQMTNNGWSKQLDQFNATVWRKDTSFVAISVMGPDKSMELFENNQTTILVIEVT